MPKFYNLAAFRATKKEPPKIFAWAKKIGAEGLISRTDFNFYTASFG